MKRSLVFTITCALLNLTGCSATLEQDLNALCTMSAQTAPPNEGAQTPLIAQVVAEFVPESSQGKALKTHLLEQPATQMYAEARAHLATLDEDAARSWSCPAMETLQTQAIDAKKKADKLAACQTMESTLDEIAYVLVPMFHAEIASIIANTLPEDKRADAKRIFDQEYAVKLKMAEGQTDQGLETTKQTIRELAGCTEVTPPEDACSKLEALIPQLTGNRRVVLIGESYGEALIQLGLDPSLYSKPLQDRLLELARTQLIVKLRPGVARLSELTQCTFK